MVNEEKISIIMNCYNSDTYLKEAIDSVINQTYQNWEIIFWDNQSTDKSAKIVQSYDDDRIKYFYAPNHTALGIARNLAVEKSTNTWISFLDSDDVWEAQKLEFSMKKLLEKDDENIALVYSKSKVINEEGAITAKVEYCISGESHRKLLSNGNFIVQSAMMVKREVFVSVGGINESLKFCSDYDLLLKVSEKHSILCINHFLTFYRMHGNNITSTKLYDNSIEVIELLKSYQKEHNVDFSLKRDIFFNNAYRIGSMFIKLVLKKEFKNMFKILLDYPFYFLISPLAFLIVKGGR